LKICIGLGFGIGNVDLKGLGFGIGNVGGMKGLGFGLKRWESFGFGGNLLLFGL